MLGIVLLLSTLDPSTRCAEYLAHPRYAKQCSGMKANGIVHDTCHIEQQRLRNEIYAATTPTSESIGTIQNMHRIIGTMNRQARNTS